MKIGDLENLQPPTRHRLSASTAIKLSTLDSLAEIRRNTDEEIFLLFFTFNGSEVKLPFRSTTRDPSYEARWN